MKRALARAIPFAPWLACLAVSTAAARADDDPFALVREEAVVQAASRHPQPASEAPAEVTVITRADIERFGWITLADVLRSVRGFYVSDDHNYSYAGVRGFSRPSDYNNRILLMLDGHKLNSVVYEDALIGTEMPIDLGALERIEIIRGPVSALYGTDGIFGAINLVTEPGRTSSEAAAGLGSATGVRGAASASGTLKSGPRWLVSAAGFHANGLDWRFSELASPGNPTGLVRGADSDRGRSVYAELAHRAVSLSMFYSSRTKYVPTASYGALPFGARTFTTDQHAFAELRVARQFNSSTGLNARAYVDQSNYHGDYLYPPAEGDTAEVLMRDLGEGVAVGTEVRITRSLGEAHSLQLGFDGELQPRARQWSYDESPYYLYIDDRHATDRASVYAQDEVRLAEGLRATLAVRHDASFGSGVSGQSTDPHFGLVLNAGGGHTVKLLAGSSYRRPTVYEIFYNPISNGSPVPALRPERALGGELAWEHFGESGGHTVASVFVDHVKDLIDERSDSLDNPYFVNLSSANCYGVELEREQPVLGGTAVASLALQRAEDEHQVRLSNSPQFLGKLRLWRPWARGRFQTALEYGFVSARNTIRDTSVGAVHLLDAHLRWFPSVRGVEVSLHVHNLLDRRYSDPAGPEHVQAALEQPGRSVRVQLGVGPG